MVDAPIGWVANRAHAVEQWTEERIARADQHGTSIVDGYPAGHTPEEIVQGNRAGPGESEITVQEIIAAYDADSPASWTVADAPERAITRERGGWRKPTAPPDPSKRPRGMPPAPERVVPQDEAREAARQFTIREHDLTDDEREALRRWSREVDAECETIDELLARMTPRAIFQAAYRAALARPPVPQDETERLRSAIRGWAMGEYGWKPGDPIPDVSEATYELPLFAALSTHPTSESEN